MLSSKASPSQEQRRPLIGKEEKTDQVEHTCRAAQIILIINLLIPQVKMLNISWLQLPGPDAFLGPTL